MRGTAVVFTLLWLMLAPFALAHPAPREREYETRLLHDCVDDYFGGDLQSDKDGHDLIALDVREVHDAATGDDRLVLRITMNGGYGGSARPTLKDVLSFKVHGQTITHEITTTDNQHFTSDFDALAGPLPVLDKGSQDGTRFALEGTIRMSPDTVHPGDKLSDYRIDGYHGTTRGDFMAGTYYVAGAIAPDSVGCAQGGQYKRADYTLTGPTYYARLETDPGTVNVDVGSEKFVELTIRNLFAATPQTFTARFDEAPAGAEARFHDQANNQYTATATVDLAGGAETILHVAVKGKTAGATGLIGLVVTSSLGGRNDADVGYGVGGATPPTPSTAASSPAPSDGGDSPGPGLAVASATLFAAAACLRRRPE